MSLKVVSKLCFQKQTLPSVSETEGGTFVTFKFLVVVYIQISELLCLDPLASR